MAVARDWLGDIATSAVGDVLAGILLLVVGLIAGRGKGAVEARHPRTRAALLALPWLLFLSTNTLYYSDATRRSAWFFLSTTSALIVTTGYYLNQFWRVGVLGSDRTLTSGLNFKKALNLCKSSLSFLGIGAGKLMATGTTFEEVVRRCQGREQPVRFLLCSPMNDELEVIAAQAGKPKSEYKEDLKKSLRRLAQLRIERKWNLEVRLYTSLPTFRLLFVDDELCLVSYYRFGDDDGSTLPQLHVARSGFWQRSIRSRSFYFGFQRYFEELWKVSEAWDFAAYL